MQLSLKYRPRTFNEIIGHPGIVKELNQRSKNLDFPQVMLFTGESGCGKSTLGMIVSQLLNCHAPKKVGDILEPCQICPSCKDILTESYSRNVFFKDCSSMGKDDIVKLQDLVSTQPIFDNNTILFLEEAQELSQAALGATLKLLEKPRPNTYFILATTQLEKINKAIQSRAQLYKMKKVSYQDIAKFLFDLLKREGISDTVPDTFIESLFLLAEYSDGNVRQAVQYLERCIYGEYFTRQQILDEFGFMDMNTTVQMLYKLLKKDVSFFKDLDETDTTVFYYASWKTLLDVYKRKIGVEIKDEWKIKFLDGLKNEPNLDALITVYNNIFHISHLIKEQVVYSKLFIDYYSVSNIPIMQKSPEIKVRPIRQ